MSRHEPAAFPPAPPNTRSAAGRRTRGARHAVAALATTSFTLLGALAFVAVAATPTPAAAAPARQVSAYWVVASDGGIFSFGGAGFYGSTGGMRLNRPVVGMAGTPDSLGYWEVASDGGIFAYGDAHFYGSTGNLSLNRPVVGMAATPDGGGYWLVAADGGIFAYGDAQFYGSTGNLSLNKPIVGMAASADGRGYWFTASDGGVFAFGDAPFYGSLGNVPQRHPIVSITASNPSLSANGPGYWFTNSNGAVSAFGGATYWGSTAQVLNQPVVGMAQATGNGSFTGSSFPSGSFGYDISYAQCPSRGGILPPAPHTIGIVQVEEPGHLNPCLAQEAAWAGAGLNLYVYMNYGNSNVNHDPACLTAVDPSSCNYGFNAAVQAFQDAQTAGVNTGVAWWLDVENDPSWSQSTASNAALVQGAIDGLKSEGLNSVGIYASPGNWPSIVGNFQPAVPYWAADWGLDPGTTCTNVTSKYGGLPTGPVQIVQYSSPSAVYPLGGMDTRFDNNYAC